MSYFIYNTSKEGFLKIKMNQQNLKKHRGFRVHMPERKRKVFECWGEPGDGEMYVFSDAQINDKAYVREILKELNIPDLDIGELIIVPQESGRGGHAPDFLYAFNMQEHFDRMEQQDLP